MIYIIHRDGRGVTTALTPREADAYTEMHHIPDSHIFFFHPDHNPLITIKNGVYHYKGQTMGIDNE